MTFLETKNKIILSLKENCDKFLSLEFSYKDIENIENTIDAHKECIEKNDNSLYVIVYNLNNEDNIIILRCEACLENVLVFKN